MSPPAPRRGAHVVSRLQRTGDTGAVTLGAVRRVCRVYGLSLQCESLTSRCGPLPRYTDDQIFRLSTPRGLQAITSCQRKGFHPHDEPNLFEKCTHVKVDADGPLDIQDFRL